MKKLLAIITLMTMLCLIGCGSAKDTDNENKKSHLSKITVTESVYYQYKAVEQELGRTIIVDTPVRSEEERDGNVYVTYTFTADTTYGYYDHISPKNDDVKFGFGNYIILSFEEYEALQKYQNETGKQVIYPTVKRQDRPALERNKYNANIYFVMENSSASVLIPKVDENGKIIPNYWKYEDGSFPSALAAEYNSLRIEGEDGIEEDGKTYFYVYGRRVDGGIEVRVDRYEYNIFREYLRNSNNAN